jgi:nucleotide-binding universal stress UspA family protein
MTRILIAIDGSKHSAKVVKAAIRHVSQYRETPELHLTFVHLPVPALHGAFGGVGAKALQRYYREEGTDALRPSAALLERAKLACTTHIMVGPIAETIVGQAKKLKCDTILMGTHGVGAVSGILLGSVAAKTVHLSECPVTLIRT